MFYYLERLHNKRLVVLLSFRFSEFIIFIKLQTSTTEHKTTDADRRVTIWSDILTLLKTNDQLVMPSDKLGNEEQAVAHI